MNATKVIIGATIAAVIIAGAVAVKMVWFPSVKEVWFQGSGRQLRLVPEGMIVVRPTRFPHAPTNDIGANWINGQVKMAGRNVTLQVLIAAAYQYRIGRVSIPDDAPKRNYDFISTGTQERFKKAVTRETGFSAHEETRDEDVLALKVENPNLPGMTVSGPDEKMNSNFKNGRMYLSHLGMQVLASELEAILKTPVVDETGLTNYYNCSLAWNRSMRVDKFNQDQLGKIIGEWGLGLEPDNESVEMLVVKKGN